MTGRDHLEAVVRRQLSEVVLGRRMEAAVAAILRAADEYATAQARAALGDRATAAAP